MSNENFTRVVVTNINMPFWSMVRFMVKWAIAAIPAILILAILGAVLSALLGGFFTTWSNRNVVDAGTVEPTAKVRLV